MVHGNLKPANILLTRDLTCKIEDFGGAKLATCTEYLSSSSKDVHYGQWTCGYVAPERLNNPEKRVNRAMNIYSIGMIFFAIFRRILPSFDANQNKNDSAQFCLESECGPQKQNPDALASMRKMISKCTHHEYQQRPKITETRDELHRLLHKQNQNPVSIAQGVANVLKTCNRKQFIDHFGFISLEDVTTAFSP